MWNELKDDNILMPEEAMEILSGMAFLTYLHFLASETKDNQNYVFLTFKEAQKYNICKSQTTFLKSKKELVTKGFLDCIHGNKKKYKMSNRWMKYGKDSFIVKEYT